MSKRPADSNFLIRFFFIHCFLHVYHILTSKDASNYFVTQPPASLPPDSSSFKKYIKNTILEKTSSSITYSTPSGPISSLEPSSPASLSLSISSSPPLSGCSCTICMENIHRREKFKKLSILLKF